MVQYYHNGHREYCRRDIVIMAKQVRCPKCKGTNIQVLGNKRKGFSAGKAVGGAAITSFIPVIGWVGGLLAGFAGKRGKYEVFCTDCGHRFKVK